MNVGNPLPEERFDRLILLVRGHKVILDADLAAMYGVTTKTLKQAVRRHRDRFPEDFMFELTWEEVERFLRSQIVILKRGRHLKYLPFAFTEQGVAMLSSVLRSPRAVRVNIEIMRAFVRLRRRLSLHGELARQLKALEDRYDVQFKVVFDAIRELMEPPPGPPKPRIGFHRP
jgi:hypothetical protein